MAFVVTRVMKMTDRWCLRLSAEGSGVTVEGSASFPEEDDTTSVADIKVAIDEDDDCGMQLQLRHLERRKNASFCLYSIFLIFTIYLNITFLNMVFVLFILFSWLCY
ncbi:hypothetical protein Hanom_Chr06g00571401 [Helianthus anomalus]